MAKILNSFKEMYNTDKPFGNRNIEPSNLLKNIVPNKTFNNNITKISNYNKNLNKPLTNEIHSTSTFPYLLIFLIVFILVSIIIIYFYKDTIISLYNAFINSRQSKEKTDVPIKNYEEEKINKEKEMEKEKEIEKNIKEKEKEESKKNNKIEQGGLKELNKKLNQNYSEEQIVKENSYCYIGYENGQRECTNVFDGDICMSGEVFPKLDICINPKLRP